MMKMHADEVHSRLRAEYSAGTHAHGCQQGTLGTVPSLAYVYVHISVFKGPKMSDYNG